jgi:integrase
LSLYKRKDSPIWWISLNSKGGRIRLSTDTKNRKLAQDIEAKMRTEIVEGRYFETQRARKYAFRQMVEKYQQRYDRLRDHHTVKQLLPVFGDYCLADITSDLVSEYRDSRLRTVKLATVYQELSLMRRMFNVARREWKWTRENPVADVSFAVGNKNARDRWLTIEEERRLLEKATNPKWLRPFLMFALHTGMRKGEIQKLCWQEVDFQRKIITVIKSKNGDKRSIPMSKTLYYVLKSIKVRDISGRVFPISDWSFRAAFGKALEKAEIKEFRPHDMRHTFATRLVQNGVDLYKVKELLGHKTISMTMRYAHHYPESLRSSVEVLDTCHDLVTVEVRQV